MSNSVTHELQKIISNKEACLVVGAGISKACCPNELVVTWSGLIKKGIEFLKDVDPANSGSHDAIFSALNKNPGNPSNYLVLAEYIENHTCSYWSDQKHSARQTDFRMRLRTQQLSQNTLRTETQSIT